MRNNIVRQTLRDGKPALGVLLGLGSPHIAELAALSGYDWLVLEAEHSAVDWERLEHMLMAISGTETVPLIRTLSDDPLLIQKALDIGAMGVFVPMVRTAAEAEAIVRATRYPPTGVRGFGPLRASKYTLDYADYLGRANENMLVALILETKEAVANLEEIMEVPGVDTLFFGLFDLCLSMGLNPNEMPFPEIDQIIESALAMGKRKGVALGIGAGSSEELRQRLAQGFTFVSYGADYQLMGNVLRAGVDVFQEETND